MNKDLPSPELLRKLLRYEPETGKLFWRERDVGTFASVGAWKRFTSVHANKEAGSFSSEGYMRIKFSGKEYPAHRIAWALHYGQWPINEIDHMNGVVDDNRIDNLRDVSDSENARNRKLDARNTSGQCGVYWHKKNKTWDARIHHNGKRVILGSFSSIQDAISARRNAEVQYGYSERHGT